MGQKITKQCAFKLNIFVFTSHQFLQPIYLSDCLRTFELKCPWYFKVAKLLKTSFAEKPLNFFVFIKTVIKPKYPSFLHLPKSTKTQQNNLFGQKGCWEKTGLYLLEISNLLEHGWAFRKLIWVKGSYSVLTLRAELGRQQEVKGVRESWYKGRKSKQT